MPYLITADSLPDYDDWGPDEYWGPQDWIAWHKALRARYGADEANRRFLEAYHKAGFLAASYDFRTFDQPFREYARANGFYEGLFPGLSTVPRVIGSLFDIFRGASSVGESAAEATQGVTRSVVLATNVLLPVLLIAAAVMLVLKFKRQLLKGLL